MIIAHLLYIQYSNIHIFVMIYIPPQYAVGGYTLLANLPPPPLLRLQHDFIVGWQLVVKIEHGLRYCLALPKKLSEKRCNVISARRMDIPRTLHDTRKTNSQ